MNGWIWATIIIAGLLLIFLVVYNIYLALDNNRFNRYCEERNSEEVKKKMNRKETIEKLLEKVDSLSDRLESLANRYEQASKDLEYLKFKQDVKGDMLVTLASFKLPSNRSLNEFMTYTDYRDESGKEGVAVGTPAYPVLKYLENNQVTTLECTDVITANIFEKIVATNFPDDQYIIKLVPEKKYYKCDPIYMFADLRKYRFVKLTLEKCQDLGINLDIDKNRKWVEI